MTKPRSKIRGLYDAFVKKDPMERFRIMRRASAWLVPEYRLKWPHMDWWQDAFFTDYLAKFEELDGLNTDRRWMMYQLLRMIANTPGDTAECGVFHGAGSYLIALMNASAGNAKQHLIFDSFEGLSSPEKADGDHWSPKDMQVPQEKVERILSTYMTDVEIYAGWIPHTFASVPERKYSFVHIDVDLYQPTLDSIDYFYPRLAIGAILLCDDYGLSTCPGATKAIDQYLEDKPEKCISLSAGAGFIIKGQPTASSQPLSSRQT